MRSPELPILGLVLHFGLDRAKTARNGTICSKTRCFPDLKESSGGAVPFPPEEKVYADGCVSALDP